MLACADALDNVATDVSLDSNVLYCQLRTWDPKIQMKNHHSSVKLQVVFGKAVRACLERADLKLCEYGSSISHGYR